jgi:hypothetical protein
MESARFDHGSRGSGLGRATGGGLAMVSRGAAAPSHPVPPATARDSGSWALVQGAWLAREATVVGGGRVPGGGEAFMLEGGEDENCSDLRFGQTGEGNCYAMVAVEGRECTRVEIPLRLSTVRQW